MAETKKFCIHSDGLGYCDILSDDTVHHYCVEGPCPHEIIVEYEPVKHGRWVDRYCGEYANPLYECSECKKAALKKDELSVLGNWITVQVLSACCPNCGAKMEVTNGLDKH